MSIMGGSGNLLQHPFTANVKEGWTPFLTHTSQEVVIYRAANQTWEGLRMCKKAANRVNNGIKVQGWGKNGDLKVAKREDRGT
mmetsp:Transcript_60967/g.108757  ORF Transcript_60967/g.108757 Transcript_60967/m.108757 type:complete len:83 (-) Transcript_60967:1020-1268(-)